MVDRQTQRHGFHGIGLNRQRNESRSRKGKCPALAVQRFSARQLSKYLATLAFLLPSQIVAAFKIPSTRMQLTVRIYGQASAWGRLR